MQSRRTFKLIDPDEDRLSYWLDEFMRSEIDGERKPADARKMRRLLDRFIHFFFERYNHEKVTAVMRRDIKDWIDQLYKAKEDGGCGYSANYVNDHYTSVSQWMKWLRIRAPYLLRENPAKKALDIWFDEPKARALTPQQVLSLKNICDRLERFHLKTDRRRMKGKTELKLRSRPYRDRAIVFVGLSTGLRREEIVNVNLSQVQPSDPNLLRNARGAKIVKVKGKRRTERTVYLSADARAALADYLEEERPIDENDETKALFLSALGTPQRKPDGRLYPRTINGILKQIGEWHDSEQTDPDRKISPLRPHDLRHTFANNLDEDPEVTDDDVMRLMGWRTIKQKPRYTRKHEERVSAFIEKH